MSEYVGYHKAYRQIGRRLDDVYMHKASEETIVPKRTVSTEPASAG